MPNCMLFSVMLVFVRLHTVHGSSILDSSGSGIVEKGLG